MAKKKLADTQFNLTQNTIKYLNAFKVTAAAKLVLIELSTHYSNKKDNNTVFPTMNYIAAILGISLTTVKQSIKDLEKYGLIKKSKRRKKYGNFNEYELTEKYFATIHFLDLKNKRTNDINYVLWREAIYKKFNGICQECGTKEGTMHAHHIKEYAKYPEKRYDIENGILLCEKCHAKIHPWMQT